MQDLCVTHVRDHIGDGYINWGSDKLKGIMHESDAKAIVSQRVDSEERAAAMTVITRLVNSYT